jgi:uncharacterized protein YdiU (UPF0061 family)
MLVGFIHGVMNTDNTSISGETIDYGPCAFMEAYEPAKVYSSIDRHGRYAYNNQPRAAQWNLMRLAETLLPVMAQEEQVQEEETREAALASANEALAAFAPQYEKAYDAGLRRKLGLLTEREGDAALAQDLLDRMATNRADFTLTFRRLREAAAGVEGDAEVRTLFADPGAYDAWAKIWRLRLAQEPAQSQERAAIMHGANPAFIPRNHLVEAVINAAVAEQDFQPFEELLDVVMHPFEDRLDKERFMSPALPEECVSQTFCGT